MRRLLFLAVLFAVALSAANFRLYLKDGSFQLVREYKVEDDRVKYYSVERSDWEEIPAALVDLKRTGAETAARKGELDEHAQALADEEAARRAQHHEIMQIPRDPGVYQLDDHDKLRIFPVAESNLHTAKGRSVLKVFVPLVNGKQTLELNGEHSPNVVTDPNAEFYLQLSEMEPFGIIKLTPSKGVRIVEEISVVPVVKESEEARTIVPTFTRQLTDNGLYKIWPQDPLPRGEYAVVEYTDGKVNVQVWDFRIQ
jgi:hypothetical protein